MKPRKECRTLLLSALALMLLAVSLASCGAEATQTKTPTQTQAEQSAAEEPSLVTAEEPSKSQTPVETPVPTETPTDEPTTETPSHDTPSPSTPTPNEEINEGLSFKIENGKATVWCSKKNVKDVVIPAKIAGFPVVEVAAKGFKDMTRIRSLVLPEGLLKIGESAFENCYALTSLVLPESLSEIGEKAFFGCEGLESVVIGHNLKVLPSGCFSYCAKLTKVVIPEGVEEINNAFQIGRTAPGDLDVTLPRSLKKLINGFSLASNYGKLKIHLPDAESWFLIDSSIARTETDYYKQDPADPDSPWIPVETVHRTPRQKTGQAELYVGDELLTDLCVPEGFERIPEYCFYGISSIETISIPEGITVIGANAFENAGVVEVTFPSTLTGIEKNAFNGCPIEALTIPGNVRTVGALKDMPRLGILSFEEGVRYFDGVENCKELLLLVIPASLCMRSSFALSSDRVNYHLSIRDRENDAPPYPCDLVKDGSSLLHIELSPDNPTYMLDDKGNLCYKIDPDTLARAAEAEMYPDPEPGEYTD